MARTAKANIQKPEPNLPISFYEQREKDNEKIKATFRCMIPMGGSTSFYFKKYPNDPVEKYEFFDGETYDIPRMVYDHVKENCYEIIPGYALDEHGKPKKDIGRKVIRFEFIPVV